VWNFVSGVGWRTAFILVVMGGCSRFSATTSAEPSDGGTVESGQAAGADGFDGGLLPGGDFEGDDLGCGLGWVGTFLDLKRVADPVRGVSSCEACLQDRLSDGWEVYLDGPRINFQPAATAQTVVIEGFGRVSKEGAVHLVQFEIDIPDADGGTQTTKGPAVGMAPDWQQLPGLTVTIPAGTPWVQAGIHAQIDTNTCIRFDAVSASTL
jgi:hypothetical protein